MPKTSGFEYKAEFSNLAQFNKFKKKTLSDYLNNHSNKAAVMSQKENVEDLE